MSVYNSAQYLREAVDSILNQTIIDFEFIIIDDNSSDESVSILKSYSDSRIVLIVNETNVGLTKNLNIGIKLAKGDFIARMDADDISFVDRFEKQLSFLQSNSSISLCGSQFVEIGNGNQISKYPINHNEIYFTLLYRNAIAHPTVMWRKTDFIDNSLFYNENYKTAQDYELWSRVVSCLKVANINETLLQYRTHPKQISNVLKKNQNNNAFAIKISLIKQLLPSFNATDEVYFKCLFDNGFKLYRTPEDIRNSDILMFNIFKENKIKKLYSDEFIKDYWVKIFFTNYLYTYNLSILKVLRSSFCLKICTVPFRLVLKQYLKCFLNWKVSSN